MVLNSIVMQGSNGAASDPSKVFKGKGMPGHMGSKTDYNPEPGNRKS